MSKQEILSSKDIIAGLVKVLNLDPDKMYKSIKVDLDTKCCTVEAVTIPSKDVGLDLDSMVERAIEEAMKIVAD